MIEFRDISIVQGRFSMEGISFTVPSGSYGVLMGTSGSGKTTLLEILCGLKKPLSGQLFLMGEDCTHRPPAGRGVGYVPQDGALFTTCNVFENLAFALRIRRQKPALIREQVEEMAHKLEIHPLLDRGVRFLSGGEKQRVALGRALLSDPGILCLDEPLAALDEATHEKMVELLRRVHRESGKTFLHITHRQTEAAALGETVVRLSEGRLCEP